MVKSGTARLDAMFHALADETWQAILRDVAAGEKTVSDVVRPYAVSLAAVSKHLNVLEEAKLIDPFAFTRSVSWVLSVWSAIRKFGGLAPVIFRVAGHTARMLSVSASASGC